MRSTVRITQAQAQQHEADLFAAIGAAPAAQRRPGSHYTSNPVGRTLRRLRRARVRRLARFTARRIAAN